MSLLTIEGRFKRSPDCNHALCATDTDRYPTLRNFFSAEYLCRHIDNRHYWSVLDHPDQDPQDPWWLCDPCHHLNAVFVIEEIPV